MTDTDAADTYNGWMNRETWAVALHINNDQGWQEEVYEALRTMDRDVSATLATAAEAIHERLTADLLGYRAGEIIREHVENLLTVDGYEETFGGDYPPSLARISQDIGSLYRVNWTELGASFLADLS